MSNDYAVPDDAGVPAGEGETFQECADRLDGVDIDALVKEVFHRQDFEQPTVSKVIRGEEFKCPGCGTLTVAESAWNPQQLERFDIAHEDCDWSASYASAEFSEVLGDE